MVYMLGCLVVGVLLVCRRGMDVFKIVGFGILAVVLVACVVYWPR